MKKILILFCAAILFTKAQAQDNSWSEIANVNRIDRLYGAGFSIGGKGYVGTGANGFSNFLKDFWEYDTATNAWTQRADFGGGYRREAVGFSIGNKGYIGTGYRVGPGDMDAATNDFWEYDPGTNTWTRKADYGDPNNAGTTDATGFSIGNKGYIGTGIHINSNIQNDFWEYDPGTNTWTRKADFPVDPQAVYRILATGFSIGGKGYIGTGEGMNGYKNDFWEYNPATDAWTEKASLLRARRGAVGFSIYGKGYIGTGDNGADINDFWEYNPATDAWTLKAPLGGNARSFAVGFSIGGKGYIGNGLWQGVGISYDFWAYTPGKSITTTVAVPVLIAGSPVSVSFTATGSYDAGNIFTAQLSDASGSFTNPVNIGSIAATTSGTINATIPGNTEGTGYRIRIVSGSPVFIGDDNGIDIPILANPWTRRADLGGAERDGAVSFSIGSKGYIGTGGNFNTYTNDFWEYDKDTRAWAQKANFAGVGRQYAVGFSIGSKGYIGTGYTGGYKNDFWEYDPATNQWTQKADFRGEARYGATAFSIGSKGYIGTGAVFGFFKNDFWEYDPATDQWTQKANFGGVARYGAAGFSIGSKGYIGTGTNGAYKNDFWEYDPATNKWTQKANFGGEGRYSAVGFSIGGQGYIGTGSDGSGKKNDFWTYDTATNAWTQKANFITARKDAVGFSIGSKGYVGTGSDVGWTKDFWEYTPETIITTVAETSLVAGSSLTVFYTATGTYNAGNVFTAQLSNASGSFAGPVNIGSIAATTYSGTINAVIPSNTKGGSGYRIRVISSNLTLIGNDNGSNITVIAIPQDHWTQKADFGGTARYLAVGFSIGGKGYIGTGYDGGLANDFWEYDTATNAWAQKANFSGVARSNATGFSIGSKGYVGLGMVGDSWDNAIFFADFWEYNPVTNQWTQKANFGGGGRFDATGFSIGSKGYIGIGNANGLDKNDFWEYDTAANQWTQKANFGGGARSGAAGFSIGRKGYIGTGNTGVDFWEYDPSINTWTRKADFGGVARQGAAGFSIGSKGYIGTGLNASNNFKNDFWEYDPAKNTWTQRTDFHGTGRVGAIGFSIGNKGYLGTGNDLGVTNDFWEYSPDPVLQSDIIIATNLSGASFCAGASISIPFITTGTLNSGNIFTAQLSTANGDFTNAVNIGTLNGTTSGSINAILPENTGAGTAYRIRVTSSDPAITGEDNGANISISTPVTFYRDADGDGRGNAAITVQACTAPSGYVANNTDCNDASASTWQSATLYIDQDGDGYAAGTSVACYGATIPAGYSLTTNGNDCNDNNANIHSPITFYRDADGDGYGNAAVTTTVCSTVPPAGYVSNNQDCDDTRSAVSPATVWYLDADNDGYYTGTGVSSCTSPGPGYKYNGVSGSGDCNDNDGEVYPGAPELCDGKDNNCDGQTDEDCAGAWTQRTSFGGTGRRSAVGFSIGDKGYIGTGYDGSGDKKDFWEYDTTTRAWSQKADFGGGIRDGATGFNIGSKGYIGTGYAGNSGPTRDFWEYDPATNIWTQKADFGGGVRYIATGFCIGIKGYIGTGNDGSNRKKDFWEYNPATNTWTQKTDFGGAGRNAPVGFSISGKGYIGTGYAGALASDFWEYDPGTNQWTQKTDFGGTGRSGAVGFSIGSKGYIGTGIDGSRKSDFWEYDPANDQWTQKTDFGGTARSTATGFSIGNKGYIGTGDDGSLRNDFWEYDPFGTPPANAITTNLLGTTLCAGASITVPFTATGTFNAGNIFTAQLSAANGDFTNAVNIGALNGTGSGSISAIIPASTAAATGYRIRVVSSGPVVVGIDNGVNITINAPVTFYRDADGDGYGNSSVTVQACSTPSGYVSNNTDCDDSKATVYPGAPEICDGLDNNCNGQVDEGVGSIWYLDADADGYGNPNISTQACSKPAGYVANNTDCDDTKASVHPNAPEICDGLDNNCNGQVDEGITKTTWYEDADGDGYGNAAVSVSACSKPAGYVANNTDCDDTKASVHPGAPEICDGIDNNCDGRIDEGFMQSTYYRDADGDGYGNAAVTIRSCSMPAGYVANKKDCYDADAAINPLTKWYKDADNDGYYTGAAATSCTSPGTAYKYTGLLGGNDCNDNDNTVYPNAPELCDGKDNNCNGTVDEGCASITVSIEDVSMNEGNKGKTNMNFTVSLSAASAKKITVQFATQNGTATAGSDYDAKTGSLTFNAGVTRQTISIAIIGDKTIEPNETFNVNLSTAVNATIAKATGTGTIVNDDGAAFASTTSNAKSVAGQSVTVAPNPANNILHAELTGFAGGITLRLMSLQGKVLIQKKIGAVLSYAEQQVDVSSLSNGSYLFVVTDEKGNSKTKKVVIAH